MPLETLHAPLTQRNRGMVVWQLLVAITMFVCGTMVIGASIRSVMRQPKIPLRVALDPWPGFEFAALARAKGFFQAEGVEVRLLELASLEDCLHTYERGQADAFFGTMVEAVFAELHTGETPQFPLVVDYSNGGDVIVSRRGIEKIDDLKGKRIAVEPDSVTALLLARALQQTSLGSDDVQYAYMSPLEMAEAFNQGQIDAAVCYPPTSVTILNENESQVIFSSAEIPEEILDVLIVAPDTLRERHDDIRAFIRAFHRAQDYYDDHPAEAATIMASRERLSTEQFQQAIEQGVVVLRRGDQARYRPQVLAEIFAKNRDALQAAGLLNTRGRVSTAATSSEEPFP